MTLDKNRQAHLVRQNKNNETQLAKWKLRQETDKSPAFTKAAEKEIKRLQSSIDKFRKRIKTQTKSRMSYIKKEVPENFSKLGYAKAQRLKAQRNKNVPKAQREALVMKWHNTVRNLEAGLIKTTQKAPKPQITKEKNYETQITQQQLNDSVLTLSPRDYDKLQKTFNEQEQERRIKDANENNYKKPIVKKLTNKKREEANNVQKEVPVNQTVNNTTNLGNTERDKIEKDVQTILKRLEAIKSKNN